MINRKDISRAILITIGSIASSVGFMVFTVPFRFPDAGVTGMGILLNYATGSSIPLFVAVVNAILLAWAWRGLSPRFVFWTIFCVAVSTAALKALEGLPPLDTSQLLLVSLIGGALKGYGAGLIIRSGASTGGTDIIVIYLQRKYGIEVGRYNFYINMCIIFAGVFIVGAENAMLGLAGVYADGVMTDQVIASFEMRKHVSVVTDDKEPIVRFISDRLARGSTVVPVEGGYSGARKYMIMCIMTRRQTVELRDFIAESAPGAFMTVGDASEVVGEGFKPWRQ